MNAQIRRLMVVVFAMFLTLMLAATYIQGFAQREYATDSRNTRAIYNSYGQDRGPIIVAGNPIAKSVPDKGPYKYQRVYTPGAEYAVLTGYYSVTANAMTGLESEANAVLSGTAPALFAQRLQHMITGKQLQGGAVELTIDPQIQTAAYRALNGRRGAAVAMNPQTGALLAVVSAPSYDPNLLASHDRKSAETAYKQLLENPNKPMDNRAFGAHDYSPGSAFKIITAAAMLSSGKYKIDQHVDAPVSIKLPETNHELPNYHHERCGDGKPTVEEAFARSCNTPFASAGMDIGADALRKQAEAFGFGEKMQIPLRVTPSVFPAALNKPQTAMSAIGQYNVRATPLEMASVAATVANNGVRMQPYLIERELNSDLGVIETTEPKELNRPISEAVANDLKQMMVQVVKTGTGVNAQLPGIQVAGKTGTAEVGNTGISNAWFVGFAPADNPQIAFAVVVEGGQDGIDTAGGGVVAAPVADAIIKAALQK